MPSDEAHSLLDMTINFKEVYRLLFGMTETTHNERMTYLHRHKRDVGDLASHYFDKIPDKVSNFLNKFGAPVGESSNHPMENILANHFRDFKRGLLYAALASPDSFRGMNRRQLASLAEILLGLKSPGDSDVDERAVIDILKVSHVPDFFFRFDER
jgi:hypothetical protein